MKVWIENSDQDYNELKGKSLFCKRLADALRKKGIFVTGNPDMKVDISLNVIRLKHFNSKVRVLRLDGVWHNTAQDFKKKNKAIKESLHHAHGVIYQSQFSRNMCDQYLGQSKNPTRVIHNGSDIDFYNQIQGVTFDCKYPVLAFSKWRPHKRLRDIICSFLEANIKDSKLYIAGNLEKSGLSPKEAHSYIAMPQIEYFGMLPQNMLAGLIKGSFASIHLCWFDSCPNSVVETICAGVPVICNNVGGTWEIVLPSGGYVCGVDRPYDLSPVDLYNPPAIDRSKIAEALLHCKAQNPKIENNHVDINNIAEEYIEFFKSLL
jgi:glycosyltransferase involved in cell wall biosynthesis